MRVAILICAALLILVAPSLSAAPPPATAAWAGPGRAAITWAPGYGAVSVARVAADGAVTWYEPPFLSQAAGGVCVGSSPGCIEDTIGPGDRFVVHERATGRQTTTPPLIDAGAYVYLPLLEGWR